MAWSVLIEGFNGLISREEVRDKLAQEFNLRWPDRSTWGMETPEVGPAADTMAAAQARILTDEEREAHRLARERRRGTPPE